MVIKTGISRFTQTALTLLMTLMVLLPCSSQAAAWPDSPKINAKSWAMIDARSGQVVASHNADLQLPPASLTKMMTLYLAFEALKQGRLQLGTKVSVSKKSWKIGGSTMFLEPRIHPTIGNLLHGIATYSGNDACIALAEHMEGSEEIFAERMNAKARELGMLHSHFVNATGFPVDGHYSSAGDMAILGAALWRDYPEKYKLFSEKDFTFKGRRQPNRNRLLWTMAEADGIKTGHTQEAGYCLVGSAEKAGTRFVGAVFGTKSDRARAQETRTLLRYGFNHFVTQRPAERDIRREVEIFEGSENHVWLKPASEVWVTIPKGSESKLSFHLRYNDPLKAPIRKGQKLGVINAVIGEKNDPKNIILSFPMVAARAVEQASWISRQWDGMRLWLRDFSSDAIDSVSKETTEDTTPTTVEKQP
ncbi:MAG: D-alanyl-D-alanine carboxypeptidase family protein [Mariprofundus sp.]|nr:D-alanyl-D-alanine carboxypeptidase family protein [Mariprofundus sp.]